MFMFIMESYDLAGLLGTSLRGLASALPITVINLSVQNVNIDDFIVIFGIPSI